MIFRILLPAFFLAFLLTTGLGAATRARDDDSETTEELETPASTLATKLSAAPLVSSTGKATTFGEQLGDGYKVVLFTKPWSDTNAQLIGELSHFHLRLNRGQLRSAVVFLRADLAAASRVMAEYKNRVRYVLDPDGHAARLLSVKTIPALMLIDPAARVRYSTPLLAQELVKQVASHYAEPEKLWASPRPAATPRRPGIPPPQGNTGQFTVK